MVHDLACGVVDDSVGTRNTLCIVAIVNGAPHEGLLQESPNERDFTPLESCHAFLTSWIPIDPQDSLVSLIETTVCRAVVGQFKVNLIAGSVDDETPIRYAPHSIGPFEWSATKPAVTAALEPHRASPEPDALP